VKKILISLLLLLVLVNVAEAWKYPKDGRFKQLNPKRDSWYYIDYNNWDLPMPDKWQHYYGNAIVQMLGGRFIGKNKTALVLITFTVLNEIDDGYREGYSLRDLGCSLAGIITGYTELKEHFYMTYSEQEKYIKLYLVFKI